MGLCSSKSVAPQVSLFDRIITCRWLPPALWVILLLVAAGLWKGPARALENLLISQLEQRFPSVDTQDLAAFAGVIALGGQDARLREAARLARRWPQLTLVVTGAGDETRVRRVIGGDLNLSRVLIETQATTTYENAIFSHAAIQRLNRKATRASWLIATSAAHMPRAVGAFRGAGLQVAPWPIFDLDRDSPQRAHVAQHEVLGLAWYWLTGRSSSLFPAPRGPHSSGD